MRSFVLLILLGTTLLAGCGGNTGTSTSAPRPISGRLVELDFIDGWTPGPDANHLYVMSGAQTIEGSPGPTSLALLDTSAGVVGGATPLPSPASLWWDGKAAFVVDERGNHVRPFDVATGQIGAGFSLGNDSQGRPLTVFSLDSLPGAPETIAVHLCEGDDIDGHSPTDVAVYDQGIRRPNVLSRVDDNYVFASNGARMLTASNGVIEADLDASGLTAGAEILSLGTHPVMSWSPLRSVGDKLYLANGDVVDEASNTIVGRFPQCAANCIQIVPARDRMYVLGGLGNSLYVYKLSTYELIDVRQPVGIGDPGALTGLMPFGNHGVAISGYRVAGSNMVGQILLIDEAP